jgi:hypothetical protein
MGQIALKNYMYSPGAGMLHIMKNSAKRAAAKKAKM